MDATMQEKIKELQDLAGYDVLRMNWFEVNGDALVRAYLDQHADLARLRGVLSSLDPCCCCPSCHKTKGHGHFDDCQLAAALAGEGGEK